MKKEENANMKVRKYLALLLVLLFALCAACGKPPAGATDAGSGNTPEVTQGNAVADTQAPDAPDYNNMTMEELYELAKLEKGKITVYSTTATAHTAVKKFVKAFPDLADKVEYIESETDTVADRIETEHDTGNINADVLQVKDNSGEIYYELVQYDYLDVFYPTAVCEHIDESLLKYGMPVYASYSPWYYNTEAFPDGCPIKSWWDIVQGYNTQTESYVDASGKNTQYWTIYTKDITSPSYAALWAQLIVDGNAMSAQYEAQYGEPLEFTYMDHLNNSPGIMEFPENNGGVELLWRFTQMVSTELDDGDQVVAAVDESLNGPTLGLCSGGKLDNIHNGLTIAWVTGLEPYTAFLACEYLYVINGCDNPAGARLFILFELGGADGQSGCLAAFDATGKWSIRDDFDFTATAITKEEVNLKSPDFEEIYGIYPNVKAYWIYWRSLAPTK
ncbi:MAG: hypothetical protein BWY35_00188 [Firmicutes bacterium ADurb.Bin248]|nr:MAG: hypothetical protein BWY35_00188 [Firmicutes bacterium ADurb.Bin248]HOG01176.1 hypothetical protein [Clostridia bacterium]HPK15145.1 hypothetical protein [Clostridia bacterium]